MKILFITEVMLGGVRKHILDVINSLDKDKFDIYFVYSENRVDEIFLSEIEMLSQKGIHLIKSQYMQRELSFSKDTKAVIELHRIIKEIKPDIVHCHSSKAGFVGRFAAKMCGVKKIFYTPHAYSFQMCDDSSKKRSVYVLAEKLLSRMMTTTTFNVSKGEMECALKFKLDKKEKFKVIYNGISFEEFPDRNEIRKQNGFDEADIIIGVTARIVEQKDPMTFLKIAEKVIAVKPNAKFIYIGDGELENTVNVWIDEHKLRDNIHMLGFRSDASKLVSMLDVYLSTAIYEGLPYSVIEAMRAGVPLIATDVVGNNELVIDGVNGIMFPVKDVEAGTAAVLEQLNTGKIKKEDVVKSFEERFSIDVMIENLEQTYEM